MRQLFCFLLIYTVLAVALALPNAVPGPEAEYGGGGWGGDRGGGGWGGGGWGWERGGEGWGGGERGWGR